MINLLKDVGLGFLILIVGIILNPIVGMMAFIIYAFLKIKSRTKEKLKERRIRKKEPLYKNILFETCLQPTHVSSEKTIALDVWSKNVIVYVHPNKEDKENKDGIYRVFPVSAIREYSKHPDDEGIRFKFYSYEIISLYIWVGEAKEANKFYNLITLMCSNRM